MSELEKGLVRQGAEEALVGPEMKLEDQEAADKLFDEELTKKKAEYAAAGLNEAMAEEKALDDLEQLYRYLITKSEGYGKLLDREAGEKEE